MFIVSTWIKLAEGLTCMYQRSPFLITNYNKNLIFAMFYIADTSPEHYWTDVNPKIM